jgi:hypothetical protein
MVKNEFQIYVLVRHEHAHSPACCSEMSIAAEHLPLPRRDVNKKGEPRR